MRIRCAAGPTEHDRPRSDRERAVRVGGQLDLRAGRPVLDRGPRCPQRSGAARGRRCGQHRLLLVVDRHPDRPPPAGTTAGCADRRPTGQLAPAGGTRRHR